MIGSKALLTTFDVDRAPPFQTGYLTMAGEKDGGRRYRLGYPSLEVRRSLGEVLPGELLPDEAREKAKDPQLRELLEANDFERLEPLFRGVFAAIPHQWHMSGPVAKYEADYASVLPLRTAPVAENGGSLRPRRACRRAGEYGRALEKRDGRIFSSPFWKRGCDRRSAADPATPPRRPFRERRSFGGNC